MMIQNRFHRMILLVLLLSAMVGNVSYAADKPEMLFFFSKDCEHCQNVKREFLPGFLETYGSHFTFVELDVEVMANIDSLFSLEDRVGVSEDKKDYPAVYFGGSMIEGEIPVRMQLEYLVKAYLANPDSLIALDKEVRSRAPVVVETVVTETESPVHIAYFSKTGCTKCSRAKEIITWLEGAYPYLTVETFDIAGEREKLLAVTLGVRVGVPEEKLMSTPAMFVGDDYVLNENISRQRLSELVEKYGESGSAAFWEKIGDEELKEAEKYVSNLFERFAAITIALAGLADGVNPCAFATILFFVSYLGMVGRKGRDILIVGLSFAFSVFLTYFLMGLGFFQILKQISHFDIVAKIIFGGTGILCVIFGFLSIGDYFKAKRGDVSEMSLQLPKFLKKRIHATIRDKSRMKSYVFGAFIAGFIVSILELACTGQVYLPTITLMARQGEALAIAYLLLYNICFIIPLLIVFGFVYFGMSSKIIAKAMESKLGTIKLILAAVFFVIGGLLLWTVFGAGIL